jgi:UDP-N-acetylglucosamine 2-epimerase (non-hydrolysing)
VRPLLVFGARPNFMKIAPVYRAMRAREGIEPILVHTGQHYDKEMSEDFIAALELPQPDVHLGVGPGSQAWQIAEIIRRSERVMLDGHPDLTVVVGDVNSTLAASIASSTLGIPLAHVEAGLRSRDWSMPEERNRVLTDRLSQYLFTPSADADQNLRSEGIEEGRIFLVGNVMIDSLDWVLARIESERIRDRFGLSNEPYGLVTLHRPTNVDESTVFAGITGALARIGDELPLLFPIHPRTAERMREFDLSFDGARVRTLPPLGYGEFIGLLAGARLVLTDSGGIQEEATVLGVPCLTLRDNTERPITIELGDNQLAGNDPQRIVEMAVGKLREPASKGVRPSLWDGRTAERIVDVLGRVER